MFREAVLAFLGVDTNGGGCTKERKERCRFEWGEYIEWACSVCEHNTNRKNKET